MDLLTQNLTLPCGAVLANRLAKAAMTEGLADEFNQATEKHELLYRRWSRGGAGLLITGNVLVDRRHLERPGNVAIDGERGLDRLRAYARAGTLAGNHLWMQVNHPGRQSPSLVNAAPIAPSAVPLELPNFVPPREMTRTEIADVITRFAQAAAIARVAGFTGVEIHAAHGYLISQFLSPVVNRRKDEWGGTLENRARFLLCTIAAVRKAVGPDFPIAVKLNSSDFQQGGFTDEESLRVAIWIEEAGVDVLELSGGTYERPYMSGKQDRGNTEPPRASTVQREAYFLDFAAKARSSVKMPIMVTGGFRTRSAMHEALASGTTDIVGIAKPLTIDPEAAGKLLSGEITHLSNIFPSLKLDPTEIGPNPSQQELEAARIGFMGWSFLQVWRLGQGLEADTSMTIYQASKLFMANEIAAARNLVGDESGRL